MERFRVVAVDQRGHGQSDKPNDGYTFAHLTGDLGALIRKLDLDRPLVAGHSWGGNVAIQFAADPSEETRGVVLIDGGFLEISAFDGMTWERTQKVMAPPKLDGVKLKPFLTAMRSWPDIGNMWSEQIQDIILGNFTITGEKTIQPHLTRENHMKILRALWEQKPSELWKSVRCPILMLPSVKETSDANSEAWLDGKRKAIKLALEAVPEATVVWMEDTIHDSPLQRPVQVASAIIDFGGGLA